jgi:hypothetical protein
MNNMKRFGITIGVCLLAIAGTLLALNTHRDPYNPDGTPYSVKLAYWKTRIHAVGGQRTYEELAIFVNKCTVGVQHNETHVFGSALYSQEGIHGVAVCDDRFEYACFHQVIGEALTDLGMDSFPKVVEVCKGSPACLHSIGHGVLAQQGYTIADLRKAIRVCETLPSSVYVQGCYGGLFMEYNMRRMLGDTQHPRPASENWLDPCDQFSGELGRICYYWQPTWWRSQLTSDDLALTESGFGRMGELCETVTDLELNASCFEGTGVIALNSGRTAQEGVSTCDFVSDEVSGNSLCRTGAARLIALLGRHDEARAACRELTGAYENGCLDVVQRADPSESFSDRPLPAR